MIRYIFQFAQTYQQLIYNSAGGIINLKNISTIPVNFVEEMQELWAKVERENYEGVFKFHVIPVVENACVLADRRGADKTVVALAGYLHDIGYIGKGTVNHENRSAIKSKRILKRYGYSNETISKVVECIISHSTHSIGKWSLESEIVRNADAIAHIQCIPYMIAFLVREGRSLQELVNWLSNKIETEWEKKLTMPEAKEIAFNGYKAATLIFENMRKYY